VYLDCPLIIDGEESRKRGYITDVLTEYALEFLDGVRDRPFCLYLSHKAAHSNFRPADRHRGILRKAPFPELDESQIPEAAAAGGGVKLFRLVPENGAEREEDSEEARKRQFRADIQGYYETLLGVDESLGQILDWLDSHGAAENTLVIFTSDSGHLWGEHGLVGKRFAYEESIRVPLLVRYPRLIQAGMTSNELVLNIDAAPTILRAAGIDVPEAMQGESYVDLVTDPDAVGRLAFGYRYFRDPPFPHPDILAVRAKNWKYVTYPDTEIPDELYHLVPDPGERTNLAEEPDHQATKKRMQTKLERLKSRYGC
jgi:N-acetylglucosamine-6-sulfatase